MGRLRDWVPQEFFDEHQNSATGRRVMNLLDVVIVEEVSGNAALSEKPWPGKHTNVFNWVRLANGLAVGFNENPSRGWSFPVMNLEKGKYGKSDAPLTGKGWEIRFCQNPTEAIGCFGHLKWAVYYNGSWVDGFTSRKRAVAWVESSEVAS